MGIVREKVRNCLQNVVRKSASVSHAGSGGCNVMQPRVSGLGTVQCVTVRLPGQAGSTLLLLPSPLAACCC